jgi:hypothetical protein
VCSSHSKDKSFLAVIFFHGVHIPYVATPEMRTSYLVHVVVVVLVEVAVVIVVVVVVVVVVEVAVGVEVLLDLMHVPVRL